MTALRELFAYNDWAQDKLFAQAGVLSDEALNQPFEMGPGTLRRTLFHLWAAEKTWLDRSRQKPDIRFIEYDDTLTITRLQERARETAAARNEFLDRLGPEATFANPVTYTTFTGVTATTPLRDLMLQVANHGVHHRAQAVNMLRRLGAPLPPPGADYIFMRVERGPEPDSALDLDTLKAYYRYSDWARRQVHAVARKLSAVALDQPFEMGLGSLRKTLVHIHDAERWWLANWAGQQAAFPRAEESSLDALDQLFDQTASRREDLLFSMSPADLTRMVEARPRPGVVRRFPIGVTMLQLCCHGTHHRAQALNMLRRLGVEPPVLDYVIMLRQAAKQHHSPKEAR